MEYRIVKKHGKFYPEFKFWLFWCAFADDSLSGYHHYGITGDYIPLQCSSLEEALEYFPNKNVPVIEK